MKIKNVKNNKNDNYKSYRSEKIAPSTVELIEENMI
jgi:hypothetical protein